MSGGTTQVGPYVVRLPEPWPLLSAPERHPLYAVSAVPQAGVRFRFQVLVGLGADAVEQDRALAAILDANGGKSEAIAEDYHGMEIRGHRFNGLGVRAFYSLRCYGDLWVFGYDLETEEAEEPWRLLLFSLVEGAVVDRGYALYAR